MVIRLVHLLLSKVWNILMHKPYFVSRPGDPTSLTATITREIRFEEIDAMRVVWHGRYPGLFEEARMVLGRKYGVGYADFIQHECPAPIRHLKIDYLRPLRFQDVIEIEAIQHWTDAARINIEYIIRRNEELICRGCTIQLMLDDQFELLLAPPAFYQEFITKWREGGWV